MTPVRRTIFAAGTMCLFAVTLQEPRLAQNFSVADTFFALDQGCRHKLPELSRPRDLDNLRFPIVPGLLEGRDVAIYFCYETCISCTVKTNLLEKR